jgi:hypothetical protein
MQEERVLALESLRATAEDLLPYDPADIYASTPTPILPHLLLLLYGKAWIHIYIYIYLRKYSCQERFSMVPRSNIPIVWNIICSWKKSVIPDGYKLRLMDTTNEGSKTPICQDTNFLQSMQKQKQQAMSICVILRSSSTYTWEWWSIYINPCWEAVLQAERTPKLDEYLEFATSPMDVVFDSNILFLCPKLLAFYDTQVKQRIHVAV